MVLKGDLMVDYIKYVIINQLDRLVLLGANILVKETVKGCRGSSVVEHFCR